MKPVLLFAAALWLGLPLHGQIILQSDMESWAQGQPAGFAGLHTSYPLGDIWQENITVHGGAGAMRLEFVNDYEKLVTTEPHAVVAGQLYDIRFWVLGIGRIRTSVFDGRAETDGFAPYNTQLMIAEDAGWQEVVQTVYVTNTTNAAEFVFAVQGPANLNYLLIDDITIGTSSLPNPVIATIAEIQTTPDLLGTSPLNGQFVRTKGVITGFTQTNFFIQDGTGPWNGILVQHPPPPSFMFGATVTLMATVEEYEGPNEPWAETRTQLTAVAQIIEHGYMDQLPLPITVSTADVDQEQWESTVVRIQDVQSVELLNDNEWVATNWQGTTIVDDLLYLYTPTVGEYHTLSGVAHLHIARRILPRDILDFELGVGISERGPPLFFAFPNPTDGHFTIFLEQQEIGTRYAIYDATGKQVQEGHCSTNRTMMDVSRLDEGVYVLHVINRTNRSRSNLVLTR